MHERIPHLPGKVRTKSADLNENVCRTFGLCVVLWVCQILVVGNIPAAAQSSRDTSSKKVDFVQGTMGELETPDGTSLGFTNFKASDGVNLRVLYGDFEDADHASRAFAKEVARALKVLQRGQKLDSTGRAVGERAEIVLATGTSKQTLSAVVWTEGTSFHEIRSRSLKDAIELEKLY